VVKTIMDKGDWRGAYRHILHLAVPVVLANLSNNILSLADTVMVGTLGTTELAAIGYSILWIFFLYAFFFGFLGTFTTFAAQYHGAGDTEGCRRLLPAALGFGLAGGLVVLALSFGTRPALTLLGIQPRLVDLAGLYVTRRGLGAPFLLASVALNSYFHGLGRMRLPMAVTVVTNALNIVLNWLLIFGHAGLPALGMEGAAIATAVANLFGFLVYLAALPRALPEPLRRWRLARWPGSAFYRDFQRVGLPAGVYVLLDLGSLMVFSTIVERISVAALAVNQVAIRILALSFTVNLGLSIAANSLVGQAAGAGDPAAVRRWARRTTEIGLLALLGLSATYLLLRYPIVHAFSLEASLVPAGVSMIWLMTVFHFFDGLAIIVYGVLKGLGDTRWPLLLTVGLQWLLGLPLAWVLGLHSGLGLVGAWLGLILEMAFLALVFSLRARHMLADPARWPLRIETGRGAA
jgi:MATE family multidrug resistance protein